MKQFLKFVFASCLGFILACVLGFFILGGIVSSLDKDEKIDVKSNSILKVELNYPINERTMKNPFAMFNGGKLVNELGVNDIVKAIKHAKTDPKIEGIYLDASYTIAGFATLKEIRDALIDFRESGKFVYAYGDIYTQTGYYVTAAADEIYLTPSGLMLFNGIQANVSFFTGTLDKIGVKMQAIKHGKYKGAVEAFTLTELSEANREQLEVLLTTTFDHYLDDIAILREMPSDSLFTIADQVLIRSAKDAKKYGLVDELYYKDEVLAKLAEKVGEEEADDINFIQIHKYASTVKSNYNRENRIAVIYGQGEIDMGESDEQSIGSETMSKAIREARNDDNVKAIVLRINSPGGSSLASDIIWREVKLAQKEKPVIVSMSDLAASGGYYIACAADVIVAHPTTITGSIGVFAMIPNAQGLLEDKLGMRFEKVKITEHADFGSLSRPLTDFERKVLQASVDSNYLEFISRVAEGRGMTVAQVDSIAQGRVWAGADALKIGLVDELGGINRAIAIAVEKAGLDDYQIIELPKQKSPFDEFFETFGMNAKLEAKLLEQELGKEIYQYYKQVRSATEMKGVQMRMPYNITLE